MTGVKNKIMMVVVIAVLQLRIGDATPLSEDMLAVTPSPSPDTEMQRKFKEKCFNASGTPDAFLEMQEVRDDLSHCVSFIFHNASALQRELFNAQEEGKLYEVVKKYCDKKMDLVQCFAPFMKTLEMCMENNDEKKFARTGMSFLKSVADYVCNNHGYRTRVVIERGGLECIDDKTRDIQLCFLQTNSLKNMFQSIHEDAFLFNEAKCIDVPAYETCAVTALRDCNNTSAIDFHNGLFKVIKNVLPCDYKQVNTTTNRV